MRDERYFGFRFEKLDVWQKSMEWVDKIYHVARNFPADEKFGLTSQLKRSSLFVASNIAEGSGRSSAKDFARFIEISYGSLMEAICQCTIAKRQGFLPQMIFNTFTSKQKNWQKCSAVFELICIKRRTGRQGPDEIQIYSRP